MATAIYPLSRLDLALLARVLIGDPLSFAEINRAAYLINVRGHEVNCEIQR